MKINPQNLMFEDIPDDLVQEMYDVVEQIALHGKIPHPRPKWMEEWFTVAKLDPRQILLTISCVLPIRITLSLLQREGFRMTHSRPGE